MAGVNFKIRGDSPPFNVKLRKNSPIWGELIEEKTVMQSGITESFLSLDYDTNYYLVATDSTSKTVSTEFMSVEIPTININFNEYYDNFDTSETINGDIKYQECIVCGCLEHNPSLSNGQSYDLNIHYNLETCVTCNIKSLSNIEIFNDNNRIFSKTTIDNKPQSIGSYVIENINSAMPITYKAYSCVYVLDPELVPFITESGYSKTYIGMSGSQNMINVDLNVSSPYYTNINTCAINCSGNLPSPSPSPDDSFTFCVYYHWMGDSGNLDGMCGNVYYRDMDTTLTQTCSIPDYTKQTILHNVVSPSGNTYSVDLNDIDTFNDGICGPAMICWSDDNFVTSSQNKTFNVDNNCTYCVRVNYGGI